MSNIRHTNIRYTGDSDIIIPITLKFTYKGLKFEEYCDYELDMDEFYKCIKAYAKYYNIDLVGKESAIAEFVFSLTSASKLSWNDKFLDIAREIIEKDARDYVQQECESEWEKEYQLKKDKGLIEEALGDTVVIKDTDTVFDGMSGVVEAEDKDSSTVLVDFKDDKKVRQDFNRDKLDILNSGNDLGLNDKDIDADEIDDRWLNY